MRKKSEARSLAPRWPKYARRNEFTTPGQGTHMCLACCGLGAVAQIFNLRYGRIEFGGVLERSHALARSELTQITNLRYGRVQLCATQHRRDLPSPDTA